MTPWYAVSQEKMGKNVSKADDICKTLWFENNDTQRHLSGQYIEGAMWHTKGPLTLGNKH